jgi:hypothetical protein
MNVAVTDFADHIVTTHVESATTSHPRQPTNRLPSAGLPVRVTDVAQS